MCIRDSFGACAGVPVKATANRGSLISIYSLFVLRVNVIFCLLYTSDAADERSSVDLGGRRIIKKKKRVASMRRWYTSKQTRECV